MLTLNILMMLLKFISTHQDLLDWDFRKAVRGVNTPSGLKDNFMNIHGSDIIFNEH